MGIRPAIYLRTSKFTKDSFACLACANISQIACRGARRQTASLHHLFSLTGEFGWIALTVDQSASLLVLNSTFDALNTRTRQSTSSKLDRSYCSHTCESGSDSSYLFHQRKDFLQVTHHLVRSVRRDEASTSISESYNTTVASDLTYKGSM